MKKIVLVAIIMQATTHAYCQHRTFSYIGESDNEDRIRTIADSLKSPLLIAGKKIYVFDCVGRSISGDINDRDNDGDENDRLNDGDANKRNAGGGIGDRSRKGRNNDRNKSGKSNKRNKNGNNNDRDEDGDINNRNADGSIAEGTRCSVSKNGKVLLYTRENIKSKKAKIYYQGKYFTNKHFKIIQL